MREDVISYYFCCQWQKNNSNALLVISLTKHRSSTRNLPIRILEHFPELIKGKETNSCFGRCSDNESRKTSIDSSNSLCPYCGHKTIDGTLELLRWGLLNKQGRQCVSKQDSSSSVFFSLSACVAAAQLKNAHGTWLCHRLNKKIVPSPKTHGKIPHVKVKKKNGSPQGHSLCALFLTVLPISLGTIISLCPIISLEIRARWSVHLRWLHSLRVAGCMSSDRLCPDAVGSPPSVLFFCAPPSPSVHLILFFPRSS